MEYHEAVRRLERGEPAPLYLVTGTEGYLVRSFLDRLRSLAGEPTLNVQVFDAADHSLQAVLEAARQLPMFGPRRVVVAAADPWLGGGRGSLGAGDLADLEAYAADPTPSTTLVFVAAEPDRRLKAVRVLEQAGQVVHCRAPGPKEAPDWVQRRAQELGGRITRRAALLLVALVGTDLGRLDSELAKAVDYAGQGAVVGEEHVRAVASAAAPARIFDLLDAVAEGRAADAARQVPLLLETGEPPLRVLAALTRQMRTLLQVRLLADRGWGADDLQKRLRLHPYVVKKSLQQARRWEPWDLAQGLMACVEAETDVKTGRKNDEAALDLLVTRLATRQLRPLTRRCR